MRSANEDNVANVVLALCRVQNTCPRGNGVPHHHFVDWACHKSVAGLAPVASRPFPGPERGRSRWALTSPSD